MPMDQTELSFAVMGSTGPVPAAMPELVADAVVFDGKGSARIDRLDLKEPQDGDLVIESEISGVSAGTEKLFWSGTMPSFPSMGYPLVPGYETVGRVVWSADDPARVGQRVFVPGAHCFKDARCLFGGTASRLVVPSSRVFSVEDVPVEDALALSLAATAYHAIAGGDAPDLIVGFGALGRLLFRITVALGYPAPAVWETNPARARAEGIEAMTAETDAEGRYRSIYDASGSTTILDRLVTGLERGGTVVLAGFYSERINFAFAPAFQKEARMRIAAEWSAQDVDLVLRLVRSGRLSLSGLISHTRPAAEAEAAYSTAFNDPDCLKMGLDWRVERD